MTLMIQAEWSQATSRPKTALEPNQHQTGPEALDLSQAGPVDRDMIEQGLERAERDLRPMGEAPSVVEAALDGMRSLPGNDAHREVGGIKEATRPERLESASERIREAALASGLSESARQRLGDRAWVQERAQPGQLRGFGPSLENPEVLQPSQISLDMQIDPTNVEQVWDALQQIPVLFHGTSNIAAASIREYGLDKARGVVTAEDAAVFAELYEMATGERFPIVDHARDTIFVTPSRLNAEFYSESLGEAADMIRDRASSVLGSKELTDLQRALVEEIVYKIDEYSDRAEPVVIALSGAALDYISPSDREAGGKTGRDLVAQELQIWAVGLEEFQAPRLGEFLAHMGESIRELELRAVPGSVVLGVLEKA